MKIALCLTTIMLCIGNVAHAHPHVFVNARAGFQFDEQQRLQALKISWRYDAFTTLFLFDSLNLDSDSDGQLSQADRATVAAAETQWPAGYNGDIHLTVAGEERQLGQPVNATASLTNGQIIVSFDLPLTNPADLTQHSVSLKIYDPSYYYAYSTTISSVSRNMDGHCQATVIPFAANESASQTLRALANLTREETPDDPGIGAHFTDEIVLTCS